MIRYHTSSLRLRKTGDAFFYNIQYRLTLYILHNAPTVLEKSCYSTSMVCKITLKTLAPKLILVLAMLSYESMSGNFYLQSLDYHLVSISLIVKHGDGSIMP